MGGPEERSGHGYKCCSEKAGEDSTVSRGCDGSRNGGSVCGAAIGSEQAKDAHQHHGEAKDVQDIDAEEISPRGPAVAERVFLDAEKEAEGENFCATADG